ncbi:nectin-3 isoform X3 [Rhineura floridana]|uniref:nectin-3 isoform X3 n=1 Tax=Rhineura floridana TaxID=261503 RepID=UPI002AC82BD8|nr:nectin-3 isoform X3 [Rhineura floridana]
MEKGNYGEEREINHTLKQRERAKRHTTKERKNKLKCKKQRVSSFPRGVMSFGSGAVLWGKAFRKGKVSGRWVSMNGRAGIGSPSSRRRDGASCPLEGGAAGATPPHTVTHGPGAGKRRRRFCSGVVAAAVPATGSRAPSMAGSIVAATPPPAPPGSHFPSSFPSPRRCCRRPTVPALPGLLSLGLLFSRVCCGALAGPIVDPHVKAVWGKNVTLKCIIDINETLTQITWEKIHGKTAQTIAVHHPEYGFSVQGEYQGRVSLKNSSLTDASIILTNITFSDSGEYVCKAVTFPLGNSQSSTTVAVLVEPIMSLAKGPNALIDGANQTVAAICTAATGKPAAVIVWEGSLGEMESTSTSYPNETVTVESKYKLVPTRFARGRHITCVVKHPALGKEKRMVYVLDIQYSPEVTVTGYDGNWYIGRENVLLRCNADANPLPMEFTWSRLDGHWPEGLQPLNNTLHFNSPLTYNYTGTYVCRVANSLGQRSDQKTVYILDVPFKQSSSVAVAGAVIGAVLALFIITIFVTVLLTPRKKRPSYLDKMIDLPPTHKPPSSYKERALSLSQKEIFLPMVNCRQFSYEDECSLAQGSHQQMCPAFKQTNGKEWSDKKHPDPGHGKVYINSKEHYV